MNLVRPRARDARPEYPRMATAALAALGDLGPGEQRTVRVDAAPVLVLTAAVPGQEGGAVWIVQSLGIGPLPVPGTDEGAGGLVFGWRRLEGADELVIGNSSDVPLYGVQVDGLMPYSPLPAPA